MVAETREVIGRNGQRVMLGFPYSPALQERLKASLGARWDSKSKRWWVPVNGPRSARKAERVLSEVGFAGTDLICRRSPRELVREPITSSFFADLGRHVGDQMSDVELRPYQVEGAQMLADGRWALLADQPGLGKTYQSLAAVAANAAWPALIVCPASVRTNWQRETLNVMPWLNVAVLESAPEGEIDADVLIVSWEGMTRYRSAFPKFASIIADEAHYAKDGRSQRTKGLAALARAIPDDGMVVALTGTPVVNCHDDLRPLLEVIDAMCLFVNQRRFRDRYCDSRVIRVKTRERDSDGKPKWREVEKWDISKHGGELHNRLVDAGVMLRRRKADVLDDLPPKHVGVQVLDLAKEWQDLLRGARQGAQAVSADALRAVEDDQDDSCEDVTEASQALVAVATDVSLPGPRKVLGRKLREMPDDITRITLLRKMTAVAKIPLAVEWVNTWLASAPSEKIVVFARHREVTTTLGEQLEVTPLIGGVPGGRRQEVIDEFCTDPDQRVLVASYEALGIGVNLQAASNVLFVEQPWTPAGCEQAEDRCHRIGQTEPVTVTYLVAADTIDEPVWAALDRKQAVVEAVIDGDEALLPEDSDMAFAAVASWAANAGAQLRLAA